MKIANMKLNKKDIKEEIQDMREAEEDFREGRYITIDSKKSAEEIDKILMKEIKKRKG